MKPKYPRTFHWHTSPGVQSDDKMHKNPDIFTDIPIVITEKLDGSNCLISTGGVYARSTGQEAAHSWFAMVRKHHAWKTLNLNDHYFYGEELFGVHSIEYGPIKEDETFRLFAVRAGDFWFPWSDVEGFASKLNVKTTPVLFKGTFGSVKEIDKWFEEEINKPSVLGGEREGFVIRYSSNIGIKHFGTFVAKYVRAGHIQTDQSWTRNWQPCKIER